MKLAIFVHDFFLEIGHSHAMIETIKKIPSSEIDAVKIIAYTCDHPDKLFPELKGKVKWIRVPFPNLYPFLLKVVFYHAFCLIYQNIFLQKGFKRISIGIAAPSADIINIQFVHHQWAPFFFQKKMSAWVHFYKKVLFGYFLYMEKKVFTRPGVKFSCLAKFVSEYMQETFSIPKSNLKTIYSGVNTERFSVLDIDRITLFEQLKDRYPQMQKIDPSRPIHLFVGAYERKGLGVVLDRLAKEKSPQIIIIGKPESFSKWTWPEEITVAEINFTKELPKFYNLCDHFVFPTQYEPFGLVLIEAASSGMHISTTEKDVGASEILKGLPGIYLYTDQKSYQIKQVPILTIDQRKEYANSRKACFEQFSWKKAGESFKEFFDSF